MRPGLGPLVLGEGDVIGQIWGRRRSTGVAVRLPRRRPRADHKGSASTRDPREGEVRHERGDVGDIGQLAIGPEEEDGLPLTRQPKREVKRPVGELIVGEEHDRLAGLQGERGQGVQAIPTVPDRVAIKRGRGRIGVLELDEVGRRSELVDGDTVIAGDDLFEAKGVLDRRGRVQSGVVG